MSGRHCLGCDAALGEPFLDLGAQPLANALLRPEDLGRPEPRFPLAVAYCSRCHLVQLTETAAPAALFEDYLYFSSFSDYFLAHARAMAEALVARFALGATSRVLEIASNDGYLLQFFQARGVPVLGVEPARNVAAVARARGIPTLARFFGPDLVDEIVRDFGRPDLVVGNNVLAHVPRINAFLGAVAACLAPAGAAVFEFPSLAELLERTAFDTIYHEHVFYYSLSAVAGLAARAGLEIADVERQAVHGGSLRVVLQRPGTRPVAPAVG
ncbi:MAG TPA: methyltransferase domain-containing protein, partial [Methylomirabilota bacterium]|nr:methyltransferase domain-containing protein [Methylomirabilota bacterium]